MAYVTIPSEIAKSATACKELLDTHAPKEHTWIRSAQVDFNLWCSAIKATSFDKSGMDHRLRNYPDARESICNLLDALKTSIEGAVGIYSGIAKEFKDDKSEDSADDIPELVDASDAEAPAWEGELEDSDSTQEADEVQSSSTKSEASSDEESESIEDNALSNSGSNSTNNSVLEEYISYVRTILDQLTRISLTIRRAGAKYRFERADKALRETEEVKAFRQHLTTIINSGFPDEDAKGLPATEKMKRVYDDSKFSPVKLKLIRVNILRRHRIKYFTEARAPRTHAPVEAPKEVQVQKPDKTPAAVNNAPPTSIVSSKVNESQPATPNTPQLHEAPVERTRSIYTAAVTATDIGPNFDTTDLSVNKTPSRITRMTKIGGSQAYPGYPKPQPNGTLICPYCNDKLPDSYVKNEQSWKAHVAQDILPYSCIMEECSNDDEMYLKADQLLAHMRAKHSLTKWTCNPCSTNTKQTSESDQSDPQVLVFFDSAESWQAHTEKEHENLGPALHRDILTELSKRQLIGPLECPLCKTEPTGPRTGIDEHILKHLHEFALRALPGDVGPANEKESTAFQVSSSASLLSYTKDNWTASVGTPDDEFILYKEMMKTFDDLESRLKRFEPEFSKQARTGLGRCRNIMERRFQYHDANDLLQIYDPRLVNLVEVCHIFSDTDKIPQDRDQPHPPPKITLEMEQDILNEALERIFDMNDSGIAAIEGFLNLLKRKVKYPIDFPLPSPGPDRVDIKDIAERIDTGLTKDTDLTRHSNKYKNSPMPLDEEFMKPTKDGVGLVRQLSLLPNIILTGRDSDKITKTTVELVNELKERVEDWSVLWVDARSVASIQKSCGQILETLIGTELRDESGDEIPRCKAKALFHYLSWTYEGLWIMVFDGLEAEGAIYLRLENMLPRSCAGTLIISTTDLTSAKLLGLAEVIQLPETDSCDHQQGPICLPNTRVSLLQKIYHWVDREDERCIFWLNGMAGTGKSTISRTVAQSFEEKNLLGASFFFKLGEGDRGTASKFFTTVAHQLVVKLPQMVPSLKKAIDLDPNISGKSLAKQFEQLIFKPLTELNASPQKSTLVLVIDALDECEREEDIKTILHLLTQINQLKSVCLRIFVTSRPELPIRLGFQEMSKEIHQDLVLHEITKTTIEHDITIYLKHEFEKVRANNDRDLLHGWPGEGSIQALVQMAIPLFIFAATVCRFIADQNWDPKDRLNVILQYQMTPNISKLGKTYLPILNQQLINQDAKEKRVLIQGFREIVGAIIILADPLSIVSLARLLDVDQNYVERRLRSLHSVLDVPSSEDAPVRLFHLSFRDFLLDHSEDDENQFKMDEKELHGRIASKCLQLMSRPGCLKQDLCSLGEPGILQIEVDKNTINETLPLHVQYACRYWVYHIQGSNDVLLDNCQVYRFLREHFLHWVEALSLMGNISECITAIKSLESCISVEKAPELFAFTHDAKRFVLHNRIGIEQAPLQIYCSALFFAPEESIIRKTFQECIPNWIYTISRTRSNWSAALQKLEGHSNTVTSVAFSPDGKVVASGSNDQTIRLWDVATGESLQTLEGHSDSVLSIAFSPDGKVIASGSEDETIRLWDVATGESLQTLEGHSYSVLSVAFSPDGKVIASGSDDQTIRLWDVATGESLHTLEGHSNSVLSIAFSPDGKVLASGSNDKTIRLWDVAMGESLQTLEGHSGWISSIAFSPDGKVVASGSYDKTIRLWDVATGESLQTLEGHSSWIRSVAFSLDGKVVASASDDKTIRLWDIATGESLQAFEGHSGLEASSAFERYSISNNWIIEIVDGEMRNTIWLPPNYRPSSTSCYKGIIALGVPSGRIFILKLEYKSFTSSRTKQTLM